MELFAEKKQCCGCMACADTCPQKAIAIREDLEGFLYPHIRQELCTSCGRCKTVCPLAGGAPHKQPRRYFAVQALDLARREISTSGAVFPIIAEFVLGQGGVVYGAGFEEAMRVTHQRVNRQDELNRLMQTKYVQSDTVGIFRRVQMDLQAGREVLFTGTPCQAEALRRFLRKEYENLLLVDLICYGVPSPKLWAKYTAYLEKKHHGKLSQFYFRDKRLRNNGHAVSWTVNERNYMERYSDNLFTSMYASNYILRSSCHACPFATVERGSDVTIGDFWGIENVASEMDDGMGTSLVILHSSKGMELWSHVRNQFCYMECGIGEVLQPRLISPTPQPHGRRLVSKLYHSLPFEALTLLKKIRSVLYAGKRKLQVNLRR